MLPQALALPQADGPHPSPPPPVSLWGWVQSQTSLGFQRTRHVDRLARTLAEYKTTNQVSPASPNLISGALAWLIFSPPFACLWD